MDAHTEARIAERLRAARAGRTTVVLATSPLLLGRADTVAHLCAGRVVATGSHADLLDRDPTTGRWSPGTATPLTSTNPPCRAIDGSAVDGRHDEPRQAGGASMTGLPVADRGRPCAGPPAT